VLTEARTLLLPSPVAFFVVRLVVLRVVLVAFFIVLRAVVPLAFFVVLRVVVPFAFFVVAFFVGVVASALAVEAARLRGATMGALGSVVMAAAARLRGAATGAVGSAAGAAARLRVVGEGVGASASPAIIFFVGMIISSLDL